jgi:hypothetical protein
MPLINGVEYSWSSVVLNIAGIPEVAVTKINFADSQTIENIYGASQHPIGRGYGKIEPTASLTLLKSAIESLRGASPTGRLQDIAPFDIVVCLVNPGSAVIVKHVIKNCQFTNDAFESTLDDTKMESELTLLPSHIVWNA